MLTRASNKRLFFDNLSFFCIGNSNRCMFPLVLFQPAWCSFKNKPCQVPKEQLWPRNRARKVRVGGGRGGKGGQGAGRGGGGGGGGGEGGSFCGFCVELLFFPRSFWLESRLRAPGAR